MTAPAIDLYDPRTYLDSAPHEAFTQLRASSPVYWQDIPGQAGYWAVLKHADVEHVARNPLLFSASLGGIVLEDGDAESLAGQREMLLAMDPPRHRAYRRPLIPSFGLRTIAGLEQRIREITREALDAVEGRDQVEFVQEVAAVLPTTVTGELFGIPQRGLGTPAPPGRARHPSRRHRQRRWLHRQRRQHADGDVRLRAREPAPGTGTTRRSDRRHPLGGFRRRPPSERRRVRRLLRADLHRRTGHHPDDARRRPPRPAAAPGPAAAADGTSRTRIPLAVEEILRWANPLHYFRRTATEDTEIRGVPIKAGEKVAMIYTSANRDEDVFPETRRPSTSPETPTAICPSGSPNTSAWVSIWPGSRVGSSSKNCSPGTRASSSPARPCGCGPISTTDSTSCRSRLRADSIRRAPDTIDQQLQGN